MRYHFGDFTLDEAGQELRQRGEVIALEPKAFQVLCYLLQHGDRVVSRDELFAQCWPDTFVSDWALTRCVARIRKAVGDGRDGVALIKTVRGRGYRFVAPLTVTPSAAVSLPDFHAELAPPQMLPERIPLPPHTPQGEATAAERRVLTVLCCTFVDPQARQRDPEEAQALVQGYHTVCAEIIHALGGYVAQYLRAGVIAYFGVPQAHDDDAQRSVWAGLRLRDALRVRLAAWTTGQLSVQVGIHTGPAVVGELGRERPGLLAVGETPAIAERLTTLAPPGTVLISAATARLVEGYVTCQVWEAPGAAEDGAAHGVYQVLGEGTAHSRFEVVTQRGLTPLVGREAERGLLRTRWAAATDGLGQVVVIMGEPGIGKSRLVQSLADQIAGEPQRRLEWRCAPSAQYSPWHPVLAHLHRVLRWRADAPPEEKLHALEAMVATAGLALPEVVPLLASALTLPLPAHYPPLTLSPQRQKQHTLDALRRWMLAETSQHPLLLIVEDLQWSDPSTLELLTLLIDHGPTAPMLMLLTARPEFQPPWTPRAHVTPLMLGPLSRSQVAQMITQMTRGTLLPPAVVAQITAQTDGVPLFVEECTAMVLESGLLQDGSQNTRTGLLSPLAIPATLHGVLMARLDRLQPAKTIAQLGATIGRTFASEVLQAVAPLDEAAVQHGLRQLVEAELVYQHGVGPTARYTFKHALIQEAAYQSLLTRTRQQYHHRVAQVLEAQFPALVETAPELLARHYTEAGRTEQAIPYWHLAGQQARQRSANPEAARHLTQGLELLATLPASPARVQQELDLRLALGPALMATLGMGAPEVEQTYARARALCAQVGETPQLFPTLLGLCRFYRNQGALSTARELGEQLYRLAQRAAAPTQLLEAHDVLAGILTFQGDYPAARMHCERGIVLTDPTAQQALALRHGEAPGVMCLLHAALTLWCLGYPVQAVRRMEEARALAQALAHPYSQVLVQHFATWLHHRRRDVPAVQAQADALVAVATAQGFPLWAAFGSYWQGWALAMRSQSKTGLAQLYQGMEAVLATGNTLSRPFCLVPLAEAAVHVGQVEEGLRLLAEALTAFEASRRGDMLTEAYRLQGEFLLQQATPDAAQGEACFQQALAVARRQQASSWELRTAMSLSRLWQQQGKRTEAYELLAPIYGWFTEGFDTPDLQGAKVLLEALAE